MIEVRRMGSQIGAEINGVDVKALDDTTFFDTIYRTWLDCNVICVRGQDLAIQDYLEYSRRFGVIDPIRRRSRATRTARRSRCSA